MAEVLLGALRLAHALAAATWIGGTLWWVIAPPDSPETHPARQRAFRDALRVGIGIFIISGAILAVQRLGSAALPPTYFGLLFVKVALGVRMFMLVRHVGGAAGTGHRGSEREILLLGVVVYALALALRAMYEAAISSYRAG